MFNDCKNQFASLTAQMSQMVRLTSRRAPLSTLTQRSRARLWGVDLIQRADRIMAGQNHERKRQNHLGKIMGRDARSKTFCGLPASYLRRAIEKLRVYCGQVQRRE